MSFLCVKHIYPVECPKHSPCSVSGMDSDGTPWMTHFCWVPEDSVWGLVGLGHVTALVFLLGLCQFFCSSNRASREAVIERRCNWMVTNALPYTDAPIMFCPSVSQEDPEVDGTKGVSQPGWCCVFPGLWHTALMATPGLSNEHTKFTETNETQAG